MEEAPTGEDFWTKRYSENQTGWDIGYPSPALIDFVEKEVGKEAKILMPGAGNAYEASWMMENGWKNVHVLDISPIPLQNLQARNPKFPASQLIKGDFFKHSGTYDFILEQTFFCALPPSMREDYISQMASLLPGGGMLAGLLFQFPLTDQGPPFGGSKSEYLERFSPFFEIRHMDTSKLSIKPRKGNELWFEAVRKQD